MFKNLRLSVKRKLHIDAPKKALAGLVASPGGVATTMIMNHLSQFLPLNCPNDSDGLKHLVAPPSWAENLPCLYIGGDEEAILASLRRRGYMTIHAAKFGSISGVLARGWSQEAILKALIKKQRTLWAELPNCLTISYDEIWDSKARIARHFCIDENLFVCNFPDRYERASKIDGCQ